MNHHRVRPRLMCLICLLCVAGLAIAPASGGAAGAVPARPATEVGGQLPPGSRWTAAGSPYVTTASVSVGAGDTLTIEPGVVVQLGVNHSLEVAGALEAVGTAESPIRFEAATQGRAWGGIQLQAGSGPSALTYVRVTGGGARGREMLGIASDAATVRHGYFTESQGVAVEIKAGASPTIADSTFYLTTEPSANPPAALRVLGQSEAIITGNFFQSNIQAVNWHPDANPTFAGNRFDRNGYDGVVVGGRISRAVEWRTLGPRTWRYFLWGSGIEILPGGQLTIGPGTTIRCNTQASVWVAGSLVVRGEATAKVVFTSNDDRPLAGQWQEIRFSDESVDYDPATGLGSVIEHAVIENGGGSTGREVFIRNASPRLANTLVRNSGQRGVMVSGPEARPQLVALTIESNLNDPQGVGLFLTDGAAPDVSFSVFRDNTVGLQDETGTAGRIGPHNRFVHNRTFGMVNDSLEVCVDASGNDWGSATGPQDPSAEPDACGLGENAGTGDLVTDNVNYLPFEGQLATPELTAPRCGTLLDRQPTLEGKAPAESEVVVYDNQVELGRVRAGAGSGGVGQFRFTPPVLTAGSHVLQAQALDGAGGASAVSDPLPLFVDPAARVDPAYVTVSYDLDDTHFVQPYFYTDEGGCAALRADNGWAVRIHPGAPITLTARLVCPGGVTPSGSVEYLAASHPMAALGEGSFATVFDPAGGGTFALRVRCGPEVTDLNLGNISLETGGFIYDEKQGMLERVSRAEVTLLEYVPAIRNYAVWDGAAFYGQSNPQITGTAGWYGFYPPPGLYKVQVDAVHYHRFLSADVKVAGEPVMLTIGLRARADRLFLPAVRRGS